MPTTASFFELRSASTKQCPAKPLAKQDNNQLGLEVTQVKPTTIKSESFFEAN
ncbi:MAG: hypothetical protein HYV13_01910 [Candidatus Doudnabacteria bacterium]|nr:hypothetical protein [Candidatus Doudnabacteria bacterium]